MEGGFGEEDSEGFKMIKQTLASIVLALSCTSALALIKQNDAYPSDDVSVMSFFDKTVDGDRQNARLDTPRDLLLSLDKDHILLFDNNGYGMRLVDKQGKVTTTKVELHRYPKNDLREYKNGNMLLADPASKAIIQVTADYTPYLFAGKRLTAAESDAKLAELAQYIMGENVQKANSSHLFQAEFDIPIDITAIGDQGWIFMDGIFENTLKFIDKKGNITKVSGLNDIKNAERVTMLRKNDDMLYLLGEQDVYKIAFNTKTKSARVTSHWNNNTASGKPQFYQLAGIAFDANQIVVVDSNSGKILELKPNNKTKTLYQIQCSSIIRHKNVPTCKPESTKDDSVFNSYGDIMKNPWDKGYIISDSSMNVLYKFSDGQLSLFTGQLKDSSYLETPIKLK